MGRKSRARKAEAAPPPPIAPTTEVAAPSSARATLLIVAGLIVITLAVYTRVSSHEFLTYDDQVYITKNAHVRQGLTAQGVRWAMTSFTFNWHPATWITHMLDVELFGLDAGKHHLVNAAFHTANVVLLFLLLQTMTRARWRSAIVAALFAVHPLHVESVAWIAERKDVLSTLFLLLTTLLYVRWSRRRSPGPPASSPAGRAASSPPGSSGGDAAATGGTPAVLYAAMLATFVLGLASKQMVITLPFALLLLDYWPLRRLELDRASLVNRIIEKIPMFLLAIGGGILAIIGQREVKAIVTTEALPIATRVANAIVAYGTYLRKTFVPAPLALPYPYEPPTTGALALSALALLGITAWVIANRERRYLFTGWFWFVGTLVPVIGLVQIGSQPMADRYTYIPHIGLLTAIVWLAADAASRWRVERVLAGVAAVVIAIFAFLANAYVAQWRDSETLFRHDLAVTQRNYIAYAHLGTALADQARFAEAADEFRSALAIEPNDANSLIRLADIELKNGNSAEATKLLETAVKVEPTPKIEGELALARGDVPKAIEKYREVVREDPNLADAHADLAAALALAGKDEEALKENREALRLDPSHYDASMNVGALLSRMGRNEEALADFRRAAQLRPSSPEPHIYLALLAHTMNRRAEALTEAKAAAQIDHDASNLLLTNALRMPMKPTNLDEFIAFLEKK